MSGLCSQQLKQLVSAQHITASHPVLKSWRQSSLQIMSWRQISRLATLYSRLLTTMGRTFLRAVKSCQGRCSWRAGMKDPSRAQHGPARGASSPPPSSPSALPRDRRRQSRDRTMLFGGLLLLLPALQLLHLLWRLPPLERGQARRSPLERGQARRSVLPRAPRRFESQAQGTHVQHHRSALQEVHHLKGSLWLT